MTHIYHHQAKFRWTENLTSRFIQLRKENGKLFTGRKYSAQAGWQYILRQMRHEFPTIMADVHYRVLKKKWSNLLQQYKELKNPVHGDKNKADDVSWPFYNAIDAIVVSQINRKSNSHPDDDEDEDIEEDVDPHEFLCVSVSPLDDQATPLPSPTEEKPQMIQLTRNTLRSGNIKENLTTPENTVSSRKRLRDPLALDTRPSNLNCTANNNCMTTKAKLEISTTTSSIIPKDIAKLRRLEMNQSSLPTQQLQIIRTAANHAKRPPQILGRETKRVRKSIAVGFQRSCNDTTSIGNHDNAIENKLNDFFEYIKQRDEENRLIMLRILHAVEKIAEKYE